MAHSFSARHFGNEEFGAIIYLPLNLVQIKWHLHLYVWLVGWLVGFMDVSYSNESCFKRIPQKAFFSLK